MSDTPRTDRAVAFDDDGYVVTASFARTLERELADMSAFRDSEMRWANQYKQERDKARECLLEAMKHADHALREDDALSKDTEHYPYHKHYWPMVQRWMKASGMYDIVDTNKKEDKQ